MREKNIQISETMFLELLEFVCNDESRTTQQQQHLMNEFKRKIDKMVEHDLYTTFKTTKNDEERERARQEYLDRKGIPSSFRW